MTKIRFYDFDDRFDRVKFTLLLRDYGNISISRAKRLMEELIDNGDITFALANAFDKDSLLDTAKKYGVFGTEISSTNPTQK